MHLKIVGAVVRPFLSLAVCQRSRNLFILSPSFPDLPYDVRVTLKTRCSRLHCNSQSTRFNFFLANKRHGFKREFNMNRQWISVRFANTTYKFVKEIGHVCTREIIHCLHVCIQCYYENFCPKSNFTHISTSIFFTFMDSRRF